LGSIVVSDLATVLLETRERGAFSGAVHTHQCLEEEPVGQLLCRRTQRTHGQCAFKGGTDLGFVFRLNPNQRKRRIPRIERPLRRFDDRAVEAIAVGKYPRSTLDACSFPQLRCHEKRNTLAALR
jgi:hypothetical protein